MRELILIRLGYYLVIRPILLMLVRETESPVDDNMVAEIDKAFQDYFTL